MLARYVHFVDTSESAAFLWGAVGGLVHANVAGWEWTDDLVQRETLIAGARAAAAKKEAEVLDAAGSTFLLVPLLGADEHVDFILGVAGRGLREVPVLLHRLHENVRHFSQVVHLLPQIVMTARPDGAFDYVSRRWEQVMGASSIGDDVDELLAAALGDHRGAFLQAWRQGIESGDLFSFEIRLRTALHHDRWFEVRAVPTYDAGRLRKWIVTLDDVHDRVTAREYMEHSRRRARALAHVGALGLNPRAGDRAFIEGVVAATGLALDARCAAVLSVNGARIAVAEPPDEPLLEAVRKAMFRLSGPAVTMESWLGDKPSPVVHVPLSFGQPGMHRLVVIGDPGNRAFDDLEVSFVNEMAWRAETVLRNRLTFRREARIAHVLQMAMLPSVLPDSASVVFDVAYQPAEDDALVGGDWYDVFELRDGRFAFSLGDVAGHGLEAAVVMGHVRELLRAMAVKGASPGDALAQTNEMVLASERGLITAFLGYIDPVTLSLDYASAGHAPPCVVRASGATSSLELGGVILGAVPGSSYATHSVHLHDDEAVVLYTDGLVEHSRKAVEGENELRRILSNWASDDFACDAKELVRRTLGGAFANDDVAMLIVRARNPAHTDAPMKSHKRAPEFERTGVTRQSY